MSVPRGRRYVAASGAKVAEGDRLLSVPQGTQVCSRQWSDSRRRRPSGTGGKHAAPRLPWWSGADAPDSLPSVLARPTGTIHQSAIWSFAICY
ncbi:MAG: hypothetical protein KF912_12435, partial [Phycisphaeraceae bacterium]|nr:hypothetical protein [Phycisphaeraceae bacterium]